MTSVEKQVPLWQSFPNTRHSLCASDQSEETCQKETEASQRFLSGSALVRGHFEQALSAFILFALGFARDFHVRVAFILFIERVQEVFHAHLVLRGQGSSVAEFVVGTDRRRGGSFQGSCW